METNRIILGDSQQVVKELDLAQIIAIVTDPPYGIGYVSHHNTINRQDNVGKWRRAENFKPIIGDKNLFDPTPLLNLGKPTIMWGANHYAAHLPTKGRWLVWDKQEGLAPAASQSDCEIGWCSIPGPDRLYHHLWRGIVRKGRENVALQPKQHPNQKPVALMKWCLGLLKLEPGSTVLDPYCGSGTTLIAALEMGLNYIGIEVDPEHYKTAQRRVYEASRQARLFAC